MRASRHSGFTLIELIIALALVAMMVGLLFGALRFGGKAWEATDQHTERDAEVRLVWQYLADRLEQANGLSAAAKATDGNHFFFTGVGDALEFVSPMPAQLGSGGLYIIRLQAAGSGRDKTLRLTRWAYHPEVLDGTGGVPEWQPLDKSSVHSRSREVPSMRAWYSESELVDDLKSFAVSYFGPEVQADPKGEWRDEWTEKEFLPWMVSIRIEDSVGAWPEMVFELPSS